MSVYGKQKLSIQERIFILKKKFDGVCQVELEVSNISLLLFLLLFGKHWMAVRRVFMSSANRTCICAFG